MKCSQCDKPSVDEVNGQPLCVSCLNTFTQTTISRQNMLADLMNFQLFQAEMISGTPGVLPRYKTTQPNYFGDIKNDIKVGDGATVGIINTGIINELASVIQTINQTESELANLINEFKNTLVGTSEFDVNIKNEILEQLTFISEELSKPKERQKSTPLKNVAQAVKDTVSTSANLISIWEKISKYF